MDITQILPRVKVASPAPIYEMVENDQTFPAGMWRWRIQGDVAILERATAADWSSDEDWISFDKGNNRVAFLKSLVPYADNVIDLGTAALSFANIHVETIVYATEVHGNWSPDTDDTYYLGTATAGWKGLHLPDTFIRDDTGKVVLRDNADTAFVDLECLKVISHGPAVWSSGGELTIATGAITVTASRHTVDTEGDAATDDLDTISGGVTDALLILAPDNSARTVVVKHGTGNILLNGQADFSMDNAADMIILQYDGTNWREIARSSNGA